MYNPARGGVRDTDLEGKDGGMKTGRWLTGIGSVILFLTGIGHGSRIADVQKMIVDSGMKAPLDAILKGCWLAFSGEMVAIAVIAVVASRLERGGSIVLICAATMIANAAASSTLYGAILWRLRVRGRGVVFSRGRWAAKQTNGMRRAAASRLQPICRLRSWGCWAKIGVPVALPTVPSRMQAKAITAF